MPVFLIFEENVIKDFTVYSCAYRTLRPSTCLHRSGSRGSETSGSAWLVEIESMAADNTEKVATSVYTAKQLKNKK